MSRTCPIYEAAKNGHKDALELLIEHGADVNMTIGWYGGNVVSPLFKALEERQFDAAILLRSYEASLDYCTVPSMHILRDAVIGGEDEVVCLILEYKDGSEYNVGRINGMLDIAIREGYGRIARLLMDWLTETRIDSIIDTAIRCGHRDFEEEFRGHN